MFEEYFSFQENPEIIALVIVFLLFVFVMEALKKVRVDKGAAILIAFVISFIAGWSLYKNRFYGWENALSIIIVVAVAALFLRVIWAFVRHSRTSYGIR